MTDERKEPGSTGKGEFYHIELLPSDDYVKVRNHDVGEKGWLERVAGMREDGERDTIGWLVSKDDAHVRDGKLILDEEKMKDLLDEISWDIVHVKGDIFKAEPKKSGN